MAVRVTTQPAIEPVSLAEAKLHCRIDSDDEDSLVQGLITAARRRVEEWEWRKLITQTLTLTMAGKATRAAIRKHGGIILPYPPLQAVTSITTVYNSESSVWGTDEYVVDTGGGLVTLAEATSGWPNMDDGSNVVTVVYTAGYGDEPEDVPEDTRLAIKMLVGHLYHHREAVSERRMEAIPLGIEAFLNPYRDARVLEFV